MAIGVTEAVAESAVTTNATSYALGAFTPSANAVLVVLVFATGTVAAGTMTGGSLIWFRHTSILYNSTDTAYLFWAFTGAAPASTAPTFDCTGDTATGVVMMAFQFTGANVGIGDPIRQVKTAAVTGANPTVTMDAALGTLNGYCAGFGMPRNPPTSAAPASWTEVADAGYATPTSGATGAFRAGGETGSTVTFTSASAAYGMLACEVYVAGADRSSLPIIWRPGDTLTGEAYARASTPVTYIDNIGTVIEVVGADVKRSAAYLGGFGPGLLVESSRTNLTVGSEVLDPSAGAWLAASVTWTANVATAPDLTLADRLTVTAAGHNIRNHHTSGYSPGNVMTWSCYVENNGGTVAARSIHNWTAGTDIVAVTSYFSQISDTEWRRLVLSFTVPAGCANFAIYPLRDSGTGVDLFSWGHQTEVGAFASSYTKTAGATSTRAADVYTVDVPVGTAATRYVRYYDLATAALVESVSPVTTGYVLTFDNDRLWLRHALAAGTLTLAQMQALYGDGKPRQHLINKAVHRAANW